MEMLMSEIRYGKSTLPECCRHVGERVKEPFCGCLHKIYQDMEENTGEAFGQIFCKEMRKCLMDLPLKEEDKEIFLHFASKDGFAEGVMQLKWMEQCREMLGHAAAELEKETAEKGRIAVGLGAMSGLLLVIILL